MNPRFSHVGICITDMERSIAFYRDGLGFEPGTQLTVDPSFGYEGLVGVDTPLTMVNQFMRLDAMIIELIEFRSPTRIDRDSTPRMMNKIGYTHLSLRYPDVDAKAQELETLGGTIVYSSRTKEQMFGGEIVFILDPDGNRIELMSYGDDVQFA